MFPLSSICVDPILPLENTSVDTVRKRRVLDAVVRYDYRLAFLSFFAESNKLMNLFCEILGFYGSKNHHSVCLLGWTIVWTSR
jgi:hypothetical protein